MSHNIAVIEGRAAMAYLGETPWHRLGTAMTGAPTVTDALQAAALDWNVELKPMYCRIADKYVRVAGRRAVVRDTDKKVLATVGAGYEVIQNGEAFGILNDACEQFGLVIETAGALGVGDRVWMLARMPEAIEPVPGDKVNGYILITSGHNGWTAHTGRLTTTRVVCQNTLSIALADHKATFKIPHVRTAVQRLEVAAEMVTNLVGTLKVTGENFGKLASRRMTSAEIDDYIDAALGIKQTQELRAATRRKRDEARRLVTEGKGAELAPGTAWTAFNAVTEFIDHTRTATSPRVLAAADKSAAFGQLAKKKAAAFKLALSLV